MSAIKSTNPSPAIWNDEPVVTTNQLADFYNTTPERIRQNGAKNAGRFTEGKHRITLSGADLQQFRLVVAESDAQNIPVKATKVVVWTRRGAARHAKMLNSEKAWEVFEALEDSYFTRDGRTQVACTASLPAPTLSDAPDLSQIDSLSLYLRINRLSDAVADMPDLAPLADALAVRRSAAQDEIATRTDIDSSRRLRALTAHLSDADKDRIRGAA